MLRSLLVPVDLSPASDRVLGRVARLPLSDEARITLLHVVPETLPPAARRRAEADARTALAAAAADLAAALPKSASTRAVVKAGAAAAEIAKLARSAQVELIVMGRCGGQRLRDVLLGSTAERVIRRGQLPVLVVRLPPRAPYRRPTLALDLDRAAPAVVELLLRVVPPPRPSVTVVHAYDIPYQNIIYPSLSEGEAEAYGERHRQEALRKIGTLLKTALKRAKIAPADAPTWRLQVQYGPPRTVIEKAVKKQGTDLLVLGTHGHTGVAYAFLGTVAGDVLRSVGCDVLVVPPRAAREQD